MADARRSGSTALTRAAEAFVLDRVLWGARRRRGAARQMVTYASDPLKFCRLPSKPIAFGPERRSILGITHRVGRVCRRLRAPELQLRDSKARVEVNRHISRVDQLERKGAREARLNCDGRRNDQAESP